ncbi:hypothetical protein VTJ83DRAFT_7 [Remersonia thermophila]|uniref:Calcium uniporter protein n=1 Tax=Remersonia thermophila TaxID=72144 RepID=A0ABR4DLB5_9PEZI
MKKGELLTTPTRLLKLVLPLPAAVKNSGNNKTNIGHSLLKNNSVQPLALLVHPQQPLSYLERLIQAEIPPIVENGKEKIPSVYFRAEHSGSGENGPITRREAPKTAEEPSGRTTPTPNASDPAQRHEDPAMRASDNSSVRWSNSTEVGDFMRDAARGREFAIEIEGYDIELRVTVPSFNDRTHYMRAQLRRMSREIDELARIKRECDLMAYRGANFLAKGGFAVLGTWWATVYYVTFHTEYGWDLIEPVTYLAGLTTIMGGYLWFLYISRDLSYKAAMKVTVSRRQNALYEARGFDQHKWEQLVQEANALRREIKAVAIEYDVDWDEANVVGEDVKEVLSEERTKARERARASEKERDEVYSEEEKRKEESARAEKANTSPSS